MLDPRLFRTDLENTAAQLARRGFQLDTETIARLEAERKTVQADTQNLQAERNRNAKAVGQAKRNGEDAVPILAAVADLGEKLKAAEARLGRLFASQAGLRRLERLHHNGLLTDEMWAGLHADYHQARRQVVGELNQLFHNHAQLERDMLLQARREALLAERGALSDAVRRGLISESVYDDLGIDIDTRLEALDLIQASAQVGWAARREG